jgi:hypothetical protein
MAVDHSGRFPNRLYAAFPARKNGRSVLVIAVSDDTGKNWRSSVALTGHVPLDNHGRRSSFAGVAVNKDGTLGIEWHPWGECPLFGVSFDGLSVAKTVPVGGCREGQDNDLLPNAVEDRLWTINTDLLRGRNKEKGPGFSTFIETAPQISAQITADAAGRFHLFWDETGEDGRTSFLSSTATVSHGTPATIATVDANRLLDVSAGSVVDVVHEEFNASASILGVDLALNNPNHSIPYPEFVEVIHDYSDCGIVILLNKSAVSSDGFPMFRVPRPSNSADLLPGSQTLPVHLNVYLPGCANSTGELISAARHHASGETKSAKSP